jgi:ubiquinone biosynthesis protein UbiJ
MLAITVTVVATLVVAGLAGAATYLLRTARDLRQQAEELLGEAHRLVVEMRAEVGQAAAEVERVERMVASAEAISDAVGKASRLMGGAVAAPVIKAVALSSGIAQAARTLRPRR